MQIISFFLLLFSVKSYAFIIGDTLDKSEFPPEVCLLQSYYKNGEPAGTCTATAVRLDDKVKDKKNLSNHFLTAAHCLEHPGENRSYKIICHGDKKSFVKSISVHPLYFSVKKIEHELGFLKQIFDQVSHDLEAPSVDLAVLSVAESLAVPAMRLMVASEQKFQGEIRYAGFGEDNFSMYYVDRARSPDGNLVDDRNPIERASVAVLNPDKMFRSDSLFDKQFSFGNSTARPGDSGGPVYVQHKKGKSVFAVISGIYAKTKTSKHTYNFSTLITPRNIGWIHASMRDGNKGVSFSAAYEPYHERFVSWETSVKNNLDLRKKTLEGDLPEIDSLAKEYFKKAPDFNFANEFMVCMGGFDSITKNIQWVTEFSFPQVSTAPALDARIRFWLDAYIETEVFYDRFFKMKSRLKGEG